MGYYYFNRFTDRVEAYDDAEVIVDGNFVRRSDGGDFDPFTGVVNLLFREDGMFTSYRAALAFGIECMKRRASAYREEARMLKRRVKQANQVRQFLERCVEYEDRLADGRVDIGDRRPHYVEDADF